MKNIKDIKSGIKSIARDVNGEPGNKNQLDKKP